MRDRVAVGLLTLAVIVCAWGAYVFSLSSLAASTIPISFGIVYGAIAVGVACRYPWARWLGMGLAISGAASSLIVRHIGFALDPEVTWGVVCAHAPLFFLLARADETPRRVTLSWILAGSTLLPTIFIGLDAFFVTRLDGNAPRLALVAVPLALVGTVALARSRTWGLLSVSAAGVVLSFAHATVPSRGHTVMLVTNDVIQLVALVLVAVILPFVGPIVRWLLPGGARVLPVGGVGLWLLLGLGACTQPAPPAVGPSRPACPNGESWDGQRCVHREVASRVECPPGAEWNGETCVGELVCPEGSHAEAARCIADVVAASEPLAADPAPLLMAGAGRDPRKTSSQPRPRAMLVTEIQGLESLYAATPKSAPDRVMLLRRLAEGYVELEYAAEREASPQSAKLVVAARKKAIEHYRRVRDEYPNYSRMDEVIYFVGYEYERGADKANAKAMYRELLAKFPQSDYVNRIPASLKK